MMMTPNFPIEPIQLKESAKLAIVHLNPGPDLPIKDVLKRICKISAQTLDVSRVGIWLFVQDRTAIRCMTMWEQRSNAYTEGTILHVADFPAYFKALEMWKALPVDFARDDPRTDLLHEAYTKPLGITSLLDAPIYLGGIMVGIICHEHTGPPREWTKDERDFAGKVADQIALKMNTAELADTKKLLQIRAEERADVTKQIALVNFAAGVAHDLRNLLTIILGNSDMIARRADVPPDAVEFAKNVIAAADRVNALAKELAAYGCENSYSPRVLNPIDIARNFLPLLQSVVGPKHKVIFSNLGETGRILIDPQQLERILLNLVINARDAMQNAGEIRISAGQHRRDTPANDPTYYCYFEVADNGMGIDKILLEHIFEPFYTTKPRGQGTGLGLAIVKSIVDRVGGEVTVDSVLGKGTLFRIYFPKVTCDG